MANSSNKIHVELYSNNKIHIELYSVENKFLGYLKSVSVYNNKVKSVPNILEAKSYAKLETASRDCELVHALTRGCLLTKIV